jgi:thioredoxin reductase (NADPH)
MHDLIIIGAGPAGLTAALYAGRFRLNTLVFEKMAAGGQIILSPTIENYPGFPGGVSTSDLVDKFKAQAEQSGVKIENKEVLGVSFGQDSGLACYNLKTEDASYQSRALIIAAGARPKGLGIKGEDRLVGKGVSYCGTCDGPLFRSKEIVVIGGGDRAIEEAIFLSGYASKVSLVHRRSALRASAILVEKAGSNPKINFVLDSVVEEILGESKVEGVLVKNTQTSLKSAIACSGVFIFVGIEPNTGFLKNLLDTDEKGFIITDQEMRTSRPAVFACGDCRKKSLYQVVTACAEGAIAADCAHKYLLGL